MYGRKSERINARLISIGMRGYSKNSPLNRCMTQTSVVLYWKENGETHFIYLISITKHCFSKKVVIKNQTAEIGLKEMRNSVCLSELDVTTYHAAPLPVKKY
jgi:hypothetical protein